MCICINTEYWSEYSFSYTSSEDNLIKTNTFALAIRLQDVLPRRLLQDLLQKRLQDTFKTFSRDFEDVFKTASRRLQKVFKTSSRRLAKMSSRRFEGVPSA